MSGVTPAWTISEELLERTGTALRTGNFADFASCFTLPHVHVTMEGVTVMQAIEDIRLVFDTVRAHFRDIGVTQIIRVCKSADYAGPDRIYATHESHLWRGKTLIKPPYPVISELVQIGGDWRIAASNYTLTGDTGHNDALMPRVFPSDLGPASGTRH